MSIRSMLYLSVAALATPALADKPQVVLSQGGFKTQIVGSSGQVEFDGGALFDPAGCPSIFDSADGGHNACSGATIADVGILGFAQYPGTAISVGSDMTLCSIEFTGGHVAGTNSYRIILRPDAGGMPDCGVTLGEWKIEGLDPFDCITDTPRSTGDISGEGITLSAGVQYWVMIYTSDPNGATWGAASDPLDGTIAPTGAELDTGCVFFGNGTPQAWTIFASEGGGGPTIRVGGSCPGTVTVDYSGFTPSTTVGVIYANSTGSFVIPGGPCAGTQLGLSSSGLQLVNTFNSGSGSGQVQGQAGVGACGGFLQLIEAGSCATSNVGQIP